MTSAEERNPKIGRRAKSRIPQFKDIEEAAAFWDAHSLAEFEQELEEATDIQFVVSKAQPKKAITVRLGQDTFAALAQQARAQGVGPSTLARLWIIEHLRQEERPSSAAS